MTDLRDELAHLTTKATLVTASDGGRLRCLACAHRCDLQEGQAGTCGARFARDGHLRAPWGYVSAAVVEPIEKKPFYHVLPGARVLSLGMFGCGFRCPYCWNHALSQSPKGPGDGPSPRPTSADSLIAQAVSGGCAAVVVTFSEPLVAIEWCIHVLRAARAAGLAAGLVTNGAATPEALRFAVPHLDFCKVDLKGFTEEAYATLGGALAPVCDSIRALVRAGVFVEVVTPVWAGFNDAPEDLDAAARFLAGVSADLPWHLTTVVSAARPAQISAIVTPERLDECANRARAAGLRFVYPRTGNAADHDTRCPRCGRLLVRRDGYTLLARALDAAGVCPGCGATLPGIWTQAPAPAAGRSHP
jgi:pyruvate formate lyase activating enzyme